MQLGTELQNYHCARCYHKLTIPAEYCDNAWYHTSCWQEGEHQLANATRLATAFKFQSHLLMSHNINPDILGKGT